MDGKALQNLVDFLKERQGQSGIVYCHKVSLTRVGTGKDGVDVLYSHFAARQAKSSSL